MMENRSLSFISYNSTGLDSLKINWINDLMESTNSACLQVQEHFKATKSVTQYFKKHFKMFDPFVTPAVRESSSHAGRPKGGLAQLIRNSINIKKENVVCKSWRIQAQILHIKEYKILWMNVYMPTDPQLQQIDKSEILETLNEIELILSTSVFNDVLLGGDWNYDHRRNTRFCRIFDEFLDKNDLVSIWTKFPADFTYRHTDLKSISLIDHFFVTKSFLSNCLDAAPIHLGDNRSPHSPIMLKIKIPFVGEKEKTEMLPISKPDWKKANDLDIDNYTMTLHEKLSKLGVPETFLCQDVLCKADQHSYDRDWHVLDVMTKIIESSFECIPISKVSPKSAERKRELLPGWKQNVLPLKNDSLFWHSIWLSMGKPNSGGVFEVMKHTRNKFHFAVRRAKKELQILKSQALAEAAAADNLALFKEMKKHLYCKKSAESVPDSLECNVTHEGILEKFQECYSELYKSARHI